MKQQTTALLLSALLLSTFASEYQLKSQHAPKAKSNRHLISTRDQSEDQCKWECSGGPNDNNTSPAVTNGTLKLLIKGNGSVIAIFNAKVNVAIVIDVTVGLVGLFDGSSGGVIIFNFKSGTGFFISGSKCRHAWLASSSNFESYFATLSLRVIFDTYQKDGTSFNSTSITAEITLFIIRILINISEEYAIKFKDSTGKNAAVLAVLIDISLRISSISSSGVLLLLITGNAVTSVDFSFNIGITGLIYILEGLVVIVGRIDGGVKALIAKSIKFNLSIILSARRGIDVFIYVIKIIRVHFKLSAIFGNDDNAFSLIILLIAQFETGGTGSQVFLLWFRALIEVARTEGKNRDVNETFIKLLIRLSIYMKGRESSYRALLEAVFSSLIELLSSDGSLSVLVKYCKDGKNKKLQIKNLQISVIVELLFKLSEQAPLQIIVTILLKLVVIRAEVALLQFILILFKYLNTRVDIYLLVLIINDASITAIINSGSTNILAEILKSINVSIVVRLLKGDISVIYNIRVIGVIFLRINAAVKSASGGALTVDLAFSYKGASTYTSEFFAILSQAWGGKITGGWEVGSNSTGGGNGTVGGGGGGGLHIGGGGGLHSGGGGGGGGVGEGGAIFSGGGAGGSHVAADGDGNEDGNEGKPDENRSHVNHKGQNRHHNLHMKHQKAT